jgi:hypothetical protein
MSHSQNTLSGRPWFESLFSVRLVNIYGVSSVTISYESKYDKQIKSQSYYSRNTSVYYRLVKVKAVPRFS